MPKMETVLRAEIIRLANKQIRTTCLPLAREVRDMKRTVRQLAQTVRSVERLGTELSRRAAKEQPALQAQPAEVEKARISGGLVRKLRTRLGLTQAELAKLAKVSSATIAFWEQGRNRPTDANKAALVALRKLGRRDVRRLLGAKA